MILDIYANEYHNSYCFLVCAESGKTMGYITNTDCPITWYTWPMDGHMACGNDDRRVAICERNGFFSSYATKNHIIQTLDGTAAQGTLDLRTGIVGLNSDHIAGLFTVISKE